MENNIQFLTFDEFVKMLDGPPAEAPTKTVVKVTDMYDPVESQFLCDRYGIEDYQTGSVLSTIQAAQEFLEHMKNGDYQSAKNAINQHFDRVERDAAEGIAANIANPIQLLAALLESQNNT